MPEPIARCTGCGRTAGEIPEIVSLSESDGYSTASEWVRHEEGTYNPANGHFLCDGCYIAAGMPTAPGGWRAP